MDRFQAPLGSEIKAYCDGCGQEIYEGEMVYYFAGMITHDEWECLSRAVSPEWITIEQAIGGKTA